jgi:hypothetical protein
MHERQPCSGERPGDFARDPISGFSLHAFPDNNPKFGSYDPLLPVLDDR